MKTYTQKILIASLGILTGSIVFLSKAAPIEEVSPRQIAEERKKATLDRIQTDLKEAQRIIDKSKEKLIPEADTFEAEKRAYQVLIKEASTKLFAKADTSAIRKEDNFFVLTQPPAIYWVKIITQQVLPFMQQHTSPSNTRLKSVLFKLKNANSALTNSFTVRNSLPNYSGDIAPVLRFKTSYDRLVSALKELGPLSTEITSINESLSRQLRNIPDKSNQELEKEIKAIQSARFKFQSQKDRAIAEKRKQFEVSKNMQRDTQRDIQISYVYGELNYEIIKAIQKIINDYNSLTRY